MKDAASIARYARTLMCGSLGNSANGEAVKVMKAIERYAARAVKAERERCVGIVQQKAFGGTMDQRVTGESIIRAISTPAKRPSRRK
jgi:hypothetical protein